MAEAMGITAEALLRWTARQETNVDGDGKRGRPEAIPSHARESIRRCYLEHYKQWGPTVLADWVKREGLGKWSHTTIAAVISDLRDEPQPTPKLKRYEVTAVGAMWSEDGAGFRQHGQKRELLVVQDEHARYKLNHRLVDGPANAQDVESYLREAFERYGAPLVLKHDGGSIFHADNVRKLLDEYGVVELTGPRHYPCYNGKKERSIRDIKSYERAMRRHGHRGTLAERLNEAVHDLNEVRPRPMLGGRTARECFDQDRRPLPDREKLRMLVARRHERLENEARSRTERDAARRRAVEEVLSSYGLLVGEADL